MFNTVFSLRSSFIMNTNVQIVHFDLLSNSPIAASSDLHGRSPRECIHSRIENEQNLHFIRFDHCF